MQNTDLGGLTEMNAGITVTTTDSYKDVNNYINEIMEDDFTTKPNMQGKIKTETVDNMLKRKVSNELKSMRFPVHIRGFKYLRDAIVAVIKEPDTIDSITKELYPAIAKLHNTTPSKVERAIRYSIECVCFNPNDINKAMNYLFPYAMTGPKGKPTNSEFIAVMADILSDEYRDLVTSDIVEAKS